MYAKPTTRYSRHNNMRQIKPECIPEYMYNFLNRYIVDVDRINAQAVNEGIIGTPVLVHRELDFSGSAVRDC